jgi:Tol biopolymer transport system component
VHQDGQNGSEAIRAQLRKIVTSGGFARAERLSHFLRLVVEETLSGRGDQIKEYFIGTEVYCRPKDYDPRTDATVRVEAAKLRKRLAEYYDGEGRDDAVVIRIPKGHYRPQFEHRTFDRGSQVRTHTRSRLWHSGWALAAVGAVIALVIWLRAPRKPSPSLRRQQLVSTFPGSHHDASFSPNGSQIAFIDSGSDSDDSVAPQVWVKDLLQNDPVQVTSGGTEAIHPGWALHGEQIVFERKGQGIWTVPQKGGKASQIIEDGRFANLSPDGSRLVFVRRREIWIAQADGSAQTRVAGVPERFLPMQTRPALSPDSRLIAFFNAEVGPFGDIWVIPAEGGIPRRLTCDQSEHRGLVWSPDGRWIIFSSARRGSLTLWRVLVTGGQPEPLTIGAGEDTEPAISPDGRRLIYTNVRTSWSLMALDPVSGSRRELVTQREMIGFPSLSPDGNRIAFFQPVGGSTHLFVASDDGRVRQQITQGRAQDNVLPEWSADGSALYYYQVRPAFSFRRQELVGGRSIEVAGWAYGRQNWAQLDPSGRAGAYTSVGTKGPLATLVRDLDTGRERPLALTLTRLQWSPDGQSILGESGNRETGETSVAICRIADNGCTPVTPGLAPRWSVGGRLIYFLRGSDRSGWYHLWSASRDGSGQRRIVTLGPFRNDAIHFDVSSDGRVVWASVHTGRQELWLSELD